MINTLKQSQKIALCILAGVALTVIGSVIHYYSKSNSAPLLRVVTRKPPVQLFSIGVLSFSRSAKYYLVGKNGAVRKVGEFELKKDIKKFSVFVRNYDDQHNIIDWKEVLVSDGRASKDALVNKYFIDAVNLVNQKSGDPSKCPNVSFKSLYVFNDRYFFVAFALVKYWLGSDTYAVDIIFEYIPSESRIVEIARFKSTNIEYIELVE